MYFSVFHKVIFNKKRDFIYDIFQITTCIFMYFFAFKRILKSRPVSSWENFIRQTGEMGFQDA